MTNDLSAGAEEGTESATQAAKRQDHSTPRPSGGSLSDQIFEAAALTLDVQRTSLNLGRLQMALEFSRCTSMQEVAALCAAEAKR